MKKIITMVLVLGLVSMVSAVPTISVLGGGPAEIAPGGTLTLVFAGEGNYAGGAFFDLGTYGYYSGNGPDGASIVGNISAPLGAPANIGGLGSIGLYSGSAAIAVVASGNAGVGGWDVVAGDWFTFDLTLTEGTTLAVGNIINIDVATGAYTESGNGIDVSVVPVPEPVTMALLGLGGLLLRKRK